MHWLAEHLRAQGKKDPQVIVFPESNDERVIKAVKIMQEQGLCKPVLVSSANMDPAKKDQYAEMYYQKRKHRHANAAEVRPLMDDPIYYASMMVRSGDADGIVAGATYTSGAVAKAAFTCFDIDKRAGLMTSCFLMLLPDGSPYGEKGVLLYADCGVIPYPTSEQLAGIALASAVFFEDVLKIEPRVAMLSYSTKGSAEGEYVDKVKAGLKLALEKNPNLKIDGELQADSALVPDVAKKKCPGSEVAGKANIMIFPNLDAGNIAYKLTERLGGARALGPLILGSVEPVSDLSRGCQVDDIIDCAMIQAMKAQKIKSMKK
jgi:phosphate acetyltransferase